MEKTLRGKVFNLSEPERDGARRGREFCSQAKTCDDTEQSTEERGESMSTDKDQPLKNRAGGEMADTLALGASAARHGGSSPLPPT